MFLAGGVGWGYGFKGSEVVLSMCEKTHFRFAFSLTLRNVKVDLRNVPKKKGGERALVPKLPVKFAL